VVRRLKEVRKDTVTGSGPICRKQDELWHTAERELLFAYSLFNDAFRSSDCIASNDRMIVNNELERAWKEAVVA
jgi:hypothetical protein